MPVYLIAGPAHSGKDTAADYIAAVHTAAGLTVGKIALGDKTKRVCRELIAKFWGVDVPLRDFYDQDEKERARPELPQFDGEVCTLRHIMQTIGTDVIRRELGDDAWIAANIGTPRMFDVTVVSDIRFPNEVAAFRAVYPDCIVIMLSRSHSHRAREHSSEQRFAEITADYNIANDSADVRDLYNELDRIIDLHKTRRISIN